MRRLVNRYAKHLDALFDGDAFDAVMGGAEVLGFVLLAVVVGTVLFAGCIGAMSSGAPPHGSCKYQHWAGKTYVCDEYYPLPTTRR